MTVIGTLTNEMALVSKFISEEASTPVIGWKTDNKVMDHLQRRMATNIKVIGL